MPKQKTSKPDGALNSIPTAPTGSGEGEQALIESRPTVARSKAQAQQHTGAIVTIVEPDGELAQKSLELEIWQSSFPRLINAGIKLRVNKLYEAGSSYVIVVLEGCDIIETGTQKRIVPL